MASVLELWVATQILTDPETTLTIFANTALPPSLIPARLTPSEVNANAASNSRAAIEPIRSCESYHLITLQILAAAEKRASALSKIVMNGLERRLLQRHQADAFETFLVAVILLLCVERMSWYFQTWNTSRAHTSESTAAVVQSLASSPTGSMNEFEVRVAEALTEAATVAASGSTKFARMQTDGHADDTAPSARDAPILPPISSLITQPSTEDSFAVDDNDGVLRMNSGSRLPTLGEWPLDHEPAYYSHQGERFAEIVHMLLKMRAIPPRTLVLEPGETDGLASSIAAHSTNMPDIDGASYAHNDLEAEAHEKMTFRTTEDDTEPERIIMPIDLATDGQIVRDWFASLRLTPQMLNDARDSPFHPHNARCWELKYVERILRPLEV